MKKVTETFSELLRNATHDSIDSHDMQISKVNDKTVKMTYAAYNANETFSVEVFDGFKFNPILGMIDLGIKKDSGAYVKDASYRKARANDLIKKAHAAIALFI